MIAADAWTKVMTSLTVTLGRAPDGVDYNMHTAPANTLFSWADALETCGGACIASFRADLLDYVVLRDGPGNDPDLIALHAELVAQS